MWRKTGLSTFYKRCLESGHDLIIYRTSFNVLYIKCKTCKIVWRFRIYATEWCSFEEWYKKGGK